MRRILLGTIGLSVVGLVLGWRSPVGSQPSATSLPGARPAIEAIRYPSLQAALDALPAEGGSVILPAGTFEIDAPLVVRQDDVLIEGSGTATQIRNRNEEGRPALLIEPKARATDRRARLWRVQLANLRLTGNPKSGHGIEANGVDELFITGVTVSQHGGDGIRMTDCYEDPRLCNNLITYNKGTGVVLNACHDIVVSGNQFEENQDALHCIDSYNLCMTGNCVDDHLQHGVVIENTYGSVLSGNMIEECQGTAIILDRDCYGITLSANVIAHEMGGGIDLRDAHGCTVSANTFTIVQKNGLVIGPKSARITVTGNTFADSFIGEGKIKREKVDSAASGLKLAGSSDVAVSGNLFSGVGPKAIESGGSRRVGFTGNVLTEVTSEHGALKDSVVTGNVEPEK